MTADPKDFIVGPDATVSDIDLDQETFTTADGRRLTEKRADGIARRTANLIPGRKSL